MNTTLDTWDYRIEQAAKILGLTPKEVEEILDHKDFKITSSELRLEMISDEEVTPFGDLRKMFCDEKGITLPKLRMAIKYLRGPTGPKSTATKVDPDLYALQQQFGIQVQLEDLDITQLLQHYNPKKPNKIHDILKSKYQDKYGAFIAFKPDTTEVAIAETIENITDLEAGFKKQDAIFVNGEMVHLYNVGRVPSETVDEDPMFVGVPLKGNRSTINYVNWTSASQDERVFIRLLVESGRIDPKNRIESAKLATTKMEELKDMYPETYLKFKTLKKQQKLPTLKISMQEAEMSKANNPFGVKRTY